jgi:hypothetical protein
MRRAKLKTCALARRRVKLTGARHRMVIYRSPRGRITRSPRSRLGFHRITGQRIFINPSRRYRRRRNPMFSMKGLLGQFRLDQALPILGGFAGGVALKAQYGEKMIAKLPVKWQDYARKYSGVATAGIGAFLSMKSKQKMMKSVGLGLIVAGVYDLIASNFAELPFIFKVTPYVAPPASGFGASIGNRNSYQTVGANISAVQGPQVVGASDDIDEMLDMY